MFVLMNHLSGGVPGRCSVDQIMSDKFVDSYRNLSDIDITDLPCGCYGIYRDYSCKDFVQALYVGYDQTRSL